MRSARPPIAARIRRSLRHHAGHGIYLVEVKAARSDAAGLSRMVTHHRSCSCCGPGPTAQEPQVRSRAASEDASQVKAWPQRVQVIVAGSGISGSATGTGGLVPGPCLAWRSISVSANHRSAGVLWRMVVSSLRAVQARKDGE
jgi:hypothetical protein